MLLSQHDRYTGLCMSKVVTGSGLVQLPARPLNAQTVTTAAVPFASAAVSSAPVTVPAPSSAQPVAVAIPSGHAPVAIPNRHVAVSIPNGHAGVAIPNGHAGVVIPNGHATRAVMQQGVMQSRGLLAGPSINADSK